MIVFLDANVLFSALQNPRGTCALLLEIAKPKQIGFTLVTSQQAWQEAQRNLQLKLQKEFHVPKIVKILSTGLSRPCPLQLPAKDQHIFVAALELHAELLLTGDHKHFGVYMNQPKLTGGILIQTVSEFLKVGPR